MKLGGWTCALLAVTIASSPGVALGQPIAKQELAGKIDSRDLVLRKGRHAQAVELARENHLDVAIPMLEKLCAEYPNDREIFFDYLVILTWDRQNEKAISFYEKAGSSPEKLPDYVRMAVGGAYFSVGKYPQARKLFASVANNISARIAEAQSAMLAGARDDGEKIFAGLIESGQTPVTVYRERAAARELIGAYKAAAADQQKLLELLPNTIENQNIRKQTTASVLRDLIKSEEYAVAVGFAEKQLAFMAGNHNFESDYIVALQGNGNFKKAVSEADRLWGTTEKVPAYGLQSLAESYMGMEKWNQAIRTYERIIEGGAPTDAVLAGQAGAYAHNGKIQMAKQLYEKLASKKNPATTELLLSNIFSLVDYRKSYTAQQLFNVVVAGIPERDQVILRVRMGEQLLSAYYPREAYDQFKYANKIKADDPRAIAGMARSAIVVGDYELAQKMLDKARELKIKSPEIVRAASEFGVREKGNVEVAFAHLRNHLDTETDDFVTTAEQRASNALSILAQWRRVKLENVSTPDETALMHSASAGVGRVWMNDSLRLWYDHHFLGATQQGGFRISYIRNFGDNVAVDFNIAQHPHEDVQALRQALKTTDYTLGITRLIGPSRLRLAYTVGSISDGNGINGVSAEWQRTWRENAKGSITSTLFATQTRYRDQDVAYDSPVRRETFGIGVAKRWNYQSHYWELAPTLKWERDWPEAFVLGPSVRLEYGKSFSPRHSWILGVEYGVFWPQEGGGGLKYGSFQYDVSYRAAW